ncbi:MAG: DUF4372 domain-containing protein [Betaproteobacteria bacterium]|nr:DUF4372 domain-containing protein [Betaproteobacteria bacterium]
MRLFDGDHRGANRVLKRFLSFPRSHGHLPLHTFRRNPVRYAGERKVKSFSCLDQFSEHGVRAADIWESLRDIEASRAQRSSSITWPSLYGRTQHARQCQCRARHWRIYADFAQRSDRDLARPLVDEPFGVELQHTVYALDDDDRLVLSVFPWASFQQPRALRLHTLLDLRGTFRRSSISAMARWTRSRSSTSLIPSRARSTSDQGFLDFRVVSFSPSRQLLCHSRQAQHCSQRRYSKPVDRSTGLLCDQTIFPTGIYAAVLPRPPFAASGSRIRKRARPALPDQQFISLAFTITELTGAGGRSNSSSNGSAASSGSKPSSAPRERGQVAIWIAVSVYVLVAIIKKRLHLSAPHPNPTNPEPDHVQECPLDQLLTPNRR